jgi:peptidoglycan/LPS O-acetylase OafA/YrhL
MKKHIDSIDGLRAIAVILVLLYHYFPKIFLNGYLGVDIFFVISGYVISRYFFYTRVNNINKFYISRFKRLIPSLVISVLLFSVAFTVLTSRPKQEIFVTGATSLIGLSNIFLYFRSLDYFFINSQLNPFLHTWSLSIEFQFYLFFPLLILFLNKKTITQILSVLFFIITISLVLFFYNFPENFFLTFSRIWEILFGSLSFYLSYRYKKRYTYPLFFLIGIIFLIFINISSFKLLILSVVVFVSFILFNIENNKNIFFKNFLSSSYLIYIGQRSYSLYLYHWPFLVLNKFIFGDSLFVLLFSLFLTIIFSLLSYRYIETPFRLKKLDANFFMFVKLALFQIVISCVIFFFFFLTISKNNLITNIFKIPQVSSKVYECDVDSKNNLLYEEIIKKCLFSKDTNLNKIYLIGDSHASQYVELSNLLASTFFQGKTFFVNADKSSNFPHSFFYNSNIQTDVVFDNILHNIKDGDYLFVSIHRGRFNKIRDDHIDLKEKIELNEKSINFLYNFGFFLKKLPKNIHVILFLDTPLLKYITNIESCYLQNKLFLKNSCIIDLKQDLHTRKRQEIIYSNLASNYNNIYVFDPFPYLYAEDKFFDPITKDNKYKMTDWNHMNVWFLKDLLFNPLSKLINN